MAETFIFSVLIIAIALVLLGIKLLLLKNGKFSSCHVEDNPGLRKRKIHCVIRQDAEARAAKGGAPGGRGMAVKQGRTSINK